MEADLRALATSWPCGWQEDDDLLTDISHPSACLTSFCPEFEPLVEELPAGLTAVEVFRRLQGLRHLLFLDSAVVQGKQGRYSYITASPFEFLRSQRDQVFSSRAGRLTGANPLVILRERLKLFRQPAIAGLPPFQGGAAGLFSYDLGRHLERLPRPRYDEFQVPALAVGLYDWVVAFDHNAERAWMIATGFPELHPTRRRSRAQRRLAWFRRRLATTSAPTYRRRSSKPVELQGPCFCVNRGLPGLLSNFDRPSYLAHVRRAVEHVHAGDCFQVNLAQRLLYPASLSAENVYERLRHCSPAFFAAYFDLGDYQLASSSPERFLCLDGNQVQTFPIKGTRPRGTTPAEDERLMEELSHSPKDRAENIMIVDLLRNDLGRVCQFGSVSVPAVCRLETFRDVHHLVSEVRGTLRADRDGIDLLQAAFPGGSITGAPKIRAMQIIAELEPHARGAYCGSLGFLGFNGTLDTNILIRTMTIGGGWIQFHVGGGIVADSIPENEYEETWHKARGLIRAIR